MQSVSIFWGFNWIQRGDVWPSMGRSTSIRSYIWFGVLILLLSMPVQISEKPVMFVSFHLGSLDNFLCLSSAQSERIKWLIFIEYLGNLLSIRSNISNYSERILKINSLASCIHLEYIFTLLYSCDRNTAKKRYKKPKVYQNLRF